MNSIRELEMERRPGNSFVSLLQRASLFAALILFMPLPSYAYAWYSGASVGSNGTVYGWGVTDAIQMPMYHVAYVSAKLTSPKGRQAYPGQISNAYTVRQDVSLSFDPTDLGTYYVNSLSSGFCYICHCWLFQYCGSYASASIGYSDNWYEYYQYSGICGELYPYEWDLVTPCCTSCKSNYFCTNTATGRLLETWYYFADVGTVRICLWQVEKGQYPLNYPHTCSDF